MLTNSLQTRPTRGQEAFLHFYSGLSRVAQAYSHQEFP